MYRPTYIQYRLILIIKKNNNYVVPYIIQYICLPTIPFISQKLPSLYFILSVSEPAWLWASDVADGESCERSDQSFPWASSAGSHQCCAPKFSSQRTLHTGHTITLWQPFYCMYMHTHRIFFISCCAYLFSHLCIKCVNVQPVMLKKTLQCLEGIHLSQSGALLMLYVDKLLNTPFRVLARMVDTLACRRVEMLLAETLQVKHFHTHNNDSLPAYFTVYAIRCNKLLINKPKINATKTQKLNRIKMKEFDASPSGLSTTVIDQNNHLYYVILYYGN